MLATSTFKQSITFFSLLHPSGTNISVLELKCYNLVKDRLQNLLENFMKLVNSELPVFMNMSINPVFLILGDDRWASRWCFIAHIHPLPLNK
jgi:hypothetical protein